MPELPDISSYLVALRRQVVGQRLETIHVRSPFLVHTVTPELESLIGETVQDLSRIGKRIVWHFSQERYLIFHLMIAGRYHWKKPGTRPSGKNDLAAFGFTQGTLMLTEASKKKRATLHLVVGLSALDQFDRGGIDPLQCSLPQFSAAMRRENHTLKRSLADPRLLSGIGNAYSDEILFAARLSPVLLTSRINDEQLATLHAAMQQVLSEWTDRLNQEAARAFPERVTAFRPEMAVHGKFGQPCVVCGTTIQRIVHAENESNYCPRCQTGGKLLADRSLSRLLKDDWPKTIEEWEERRNS